MHYRLSKKYRLRKNADFQALYKTGKSIANRLLVIYLTVGDNKDRRVGFAAGKRLGGAVVRNRVKRLLREAYRLNQHQLKDGLNMIIVGRRPVVNAGLPEVARAFLDLGKRLKIITK